MDEDTAERLRFLEERILNLQAHQMMSTVSIAVLRSLVAQVAEKAGAGHLGQGHLDDIHLAGLKAALNTILANLSDTDPRLATMLREEMKKTNMI